MAELRLRIDPSGMVTGAAQAERALEGVERQAARTESATEQMGRGFRNAAQGADAAAAGARGVTAAAGNSYMLRGLAQQLNQVGQQGAATGNFLGALAIQLPDILTMFGKWGVYAGAAAGFLAPFALGLIDLGEGAKSLAEEIDDLNDALADSKEASALAAGSFADLKEEFGSAGAGVRALAQAFAEISLRRVVDEANEAVDALTSLYDGSAILNESAAEQMGAAFGLGTRGARSLADDAAAVRSADTLEKQLAAVERLRENFVALVGPVGQMTEDQLEYYIAIADTQRGLEQVTSRIVEAQKDQTVNLRAQYGLFRTMIEDARRLAATDALGEQYRIYGLIRSEAEAAARSAADEVEALRQKAEVGAATARTGADSLATARARVAAEREAYAETVNVRDVSDDMKRALMEAWDAANGLVAASRNADFADARANAAAMANEVERALAALNGMAAASRANLQDERLRSQFADDPVGLAGALAGAAFDRQTAGATTDPLLADAIAAQRAELVAQAEDAARERKAREDAAESARKGEAAATRAAREAERAADEQARALERQRDAYDGLISRLDPATGASLRFAEATETINAALAQGHITAAEAARAHDLAGKEMEKTLADLDQSASLWNGLGSAANSAFTGIVTGTQKVGDAVASMLDRIAALLASRAFDTVLSEIMGTPGTGGSGDSGGTLSKLFGIGLSAAGSAFGSVFGTNYASTANASVGTGGAPTFAAPGGTQPLANGDVIDRPTIFPIAGGRRALTAEAGDPEAIMPLERGGDGRLGVRAYGAGGGSPFVYAPVFHAPGADAGALAALRADVERQGKEFARRLGAEIASPGSPADRALRGRGVKAIAR